MAYNDQTPTPPGVRMKTKSDLVKFLALAATTYVVFLKALEYFDKKTRKSINP